MPLAVVGGWIASRVSINNDATASATIEVVSFAFVPNLTIRGKWRIRANKSISSNGRISPYERIYSLDEKKKKKKFTFKRKFRRRYFIAQRENVSFYRDDFSLFPIRGSP